LSFRKVLIFSNAHTIFHLYLNVLFFSVSLEDEHFQHVPREGFASKDIQAIKK